jgi:hypothetical protein
MAEFSFTNELLAAAATWGVAAAGACVALFFTPIVDRVKLRLSRAALRVKQFEEFAADLSNFIFHAELEHEFLGNGWITAEQLNPITESYNDAITALRKKELVYLSWADRYWSAPELPLFDNVLTAVHEVDRAVHLFNDGRITQDRIESLQMKIGVLRDSAGKLLAPAASKLWRKRG